MVSPGSMDKSSTIQSRMTLNDFIDAVYAKPHGYGRPDTEFLPLARAFGVYSKNTYRGLLPGAVWQLPKGDEIFDASTTDKESIENKPTWEMTLSGVVIPDGMDDHEMLCRSSVQIDLIAQASYGHGRYHLECILSAIDNRYGKGDPFFSEHDDGIIMNLTTVKPLMMTQLRYQDSEFYSKELLSVPPSKLWFMGLIPGLEAEIHKPSLKIVVNQ